MLRITPIAVVAITVLIIPLSAHGQYSTSTDDAGSPVAGVWSAVKVSFTGPDTSWTNETTQPEILIFSDQYWTAVRINGRSPRTRLEDDATDEQLLAAFRRVRMSAGKYEVDGPAMTTHTISHWNPNVEAERRTNTSSFEVDGDKMIRTFKNDENDRQWVVTYGRRDEGPATEVDGIWKALEVHFTSPDTSWSRNVETPSITAFSHGYYATSWVAGWEPRKLWPEDGPTDEQRLSSMRRLRGSAGTISVSDGMISSKAIVHWNPNVMAEPETNTSTYELDGKELWRTFRNEENGNEWRVKYRRLE